MPQHPTPQTETERPTPPSTGRITTVVGGFSSPRYAGIWTLETHPHCFANLSDGGVSRTSREKQQPPSPPRLHIHRPPFVAETHNPGIYPLAAASYAPYPRAMRGPRNTHAPCADAAPAPACACASGGPPCHATPGALLDHVIGTQRPCKAHAFKSYNSRRLRRRCYIRRRPRCRCGRRRA